MRYLQIIRHIQNYNSRKGPRFYCISSRSIQQKWTCIITDNEWIAKWEYIHLKNRNIFNNLYIRICLALEVSNYISDFLSHRNLALARVPLELIKEKFIIHGLANTPTTNAKADTFLKEYYSNCHYFASSIMI